MKRKEILERLQKQFPDVTFAPDEALSEGIHIDAAALPDVAAFLRDDPELAFNFCNYITGLDFKSHRLVLYYLSSIVHGHKVALKVKLPTEGPSVESISHLYGCANWYEREVYDLFGVTFRNHPDLRRIMLPDDWEGHPMLKDYTHENLIRKPD
jgi:NADH-quinone oxidoreductase subunit C